MPTQVAAAEKLPVDGPYKVMELIARPRSLEIIRRNPDEPTLGDVMIFTNDVYRDDEQVGFDGGVCTVARIVDDMPYIQCDVGLQLPEGLITAQVLKEDVIPPPPFYSAITGSTGAYANARGQIYINPNSPEIHYYTVYLED